MLQIDNHNEQTSLSITIVCLNAAGVIFKRPEKNIGGMEVRAWTLAKALAGQSQTQVSFVIRDHAAKSQAVENVQVDPFESKWSRAVAELSPYLSRIYSFPWLKVRRWSLGLLTSTTRVIALKLFASSEKQTTFDKTLQATNADTFVAFGVSYYTRYMIDLAKRLKKPSVVMIAWDGDLDERNRPGTGYVSQFGDRADDTWWILQNADQIIVQTLAQQVILKDRFGRASYLLENPIDLAWWQTPSTASLPTDVQRAAGAWLWVGRCERHHKQPQLLIKLAKECPDERFLMILNPRDNELEAEIRRDCPPNVTIIENVPYESMPAVYQQSKGLISTSSQEGFPNTFLQTAASGKPVISLNVADAFLNESQSGICAKGNWNQFITNIKSPPKPSAQTQTYLQKHHSLDSVTLRFRTLLESLKQNH